MPAYIWMDDPNTLDLSMIKSKISAMRTLGVPYEEGFEDKAEADARTQAEEIATNIATDLATTVKGVNKEQKIKELKNKEIVALIAYLQRLGRDIKAIDENTKK